jgi:MFS family permease
VTRAETQPHREQRGAHRARGVDGANGVDRADEADGVERDDVADGVDRADVADGVDRDGRAVTSAPADAFDRRLIPPMILGSLLNPVNSSMLAVALIPIGIALGAPPSDTVWLVSALYLATAVGQPVVGRLVDTYGPRPLYLAGATLVGLAGALGAVAPNLPVLVVARVLIGLGTCAGYPAAMYLIRSEGQRTGRNSPSGVLAALSVATQVTAVIGPTLGGLLIGVGGWRTIFTVNVPLAAASLLLGWRRLPRTAPTTTGAAVVGQRRGAGLDVPGIGLFGAMLTSAMLFLMDPHLGRAYLLVVAAAAGVGFVVRERRVADPFIDLRLLAGNPPLIATYLRQVLTFTVSYAFLYGYTQWLEAGRGLSASAAGLLLLPMFVTGIVATSTAGRRPKVRGKLVVGSLAQIAACLVLLLVVGSSSPIWVLVVVAVIAGIPQGLNGLANQNALYHQADPARIGSSAGLLRTFTYLGALAAAAANASFFAGGADTAGLHDLSLFVMACAAALLVLTLVDRSLRRIGAPSASHTR